MKVMISSVRRGLEPERDALPGLIMALGHEPVRFEDFSAQPVPSRQACLEAVAASDVYLLLLGPNYGHVFPETNQSATHDEFAAAQAKGIPRLTFRKTGVDFEPAQALFEKLVGDYGPGLFYATFTGATDLQAKVVQALRQIEARPSALSFEPLQSPLAIQWRRDWNRNGGLTACLEIHVLPVPPAPLTARLMDQARAGLLAALRSSNAVPPDVALQLEHEPSGATTIRLPEVRRQFDDIDTGTLRGVRLAPSGQLSLWYTLPRGRTLPVADQDDLTERIAGGLRLAGRLDLSDADKLAVAVGIDPATMITIGRVAELATRNSATIAGAGRLDHVHIEPDEAASRSALDTGATEVARPLARRLIDALR
jgi:Domain of unknown function (DUF4062)